MRKELKKQLSSLEKQDINDTLFFRDHFDPFFEKLMSTSTGSSEFLEMWEGNGDIMVDAIKYALSVHDSLSLPRNHYSSKEYNCPYYLDKDTMQWLYSTVLYGLHINDDYTEQAEKTISLESKKGNFVVEKHTAEFMFNMALKHGKVFELLNVIKTHKKKFPKGFKVSASTQHINTALIPLSKVCLFSNAKIRIVR